MTMNNHFLIKLPNRNDLEVESLEYPGLKILETEAIDALVIQGNWGFNYLGGSGDIIAKYIDLTEEELREIVNLQRNSQEIIIKLLIQKNINGRTRAIALVPNSNFECYKNYTHPSGRASKDFYYNVAYEAFNALSGIGCKNIAIGALAESDAFSSQLKNAVAEAMVHAASENHSLSKFYDLCGNDRESNYVHGLNFFQKSNELTSEHKKISSISLNHEYSVGILLSREIWGLKTLNSPSTHEEIINAIKRIGKIKIKLNLVILKIDAKNTL